MGTYHSARRGELPGIEHLAAVSHFTIGRSVAFVHDLAAVGELPSPYDGCDVLYTEMAWRPGYEKFQQRARAAEPAGSGTPTDFRAYCTALANVAECARAPFYLVTGKSLLRYFPAPAALFPASLAGGDVVVAVYRAAWRADGPVPTTTEVLGELAVKYQRVGDPCCGYGNTGRAFLERGKSFVLSDMNPRCIAVVAAHAPGWGRP